MTARWEIVRTAAAQPWHVREVAGNAEKTWVIENYTRKQSAERALCRLAERFGWQGVTLVWDGDDGQLVSDMGILIASVCLVDER